MYFILLKTTNIVSLLRLFKMLLGGIKFNEGFYLKTASIANALYNNAIGYATRNLCSFMFNTVTNMTDAELVHHIIDSTAAIVLSHALNELKDVYDT